MIQGSKIDVILRSSGKTSFVTFLRDLSGKDWNPRRVSIVEGMKGFYPKTKLSRARQRSFKQSSSPLVSVLYNISPLPSCSSSGVWFL